ncbi:MAG: RecX family transcriptional regulator [Chloroflexi bacterium]|nr:MAG: RecX family transcriptional regulator [Chloroflexota bacterium]
MAKGTMSANIITALEVQKRNKERVNVFIDGEFAFGLSLIEAAKLRKGQILSEAEIEALQNADAVIQAVDRAVRFLSYRPRSIQEVRRNLAKKNMPDAVIDQTIERLINLGYVDDRAFARFWVENRQEFKPRSPKALRYELRQKGVAESDIAAVLHDFDSDDAAYRAAQSRVTRLRGSTRRVFRKKVGAFLARRGFAYGTAHAVVERLIEEIETDEPDYFHEEVEEQGRDDYPFN